jgi:large subunit ribosomal protein L1
MDKELIASTLKKLKESSPKKNFKQSIDLIINLKGLDLKKTEHQINMFITLHQGTGKPVSVCALVDREMESKAKEACNEVIVSDQFEPFKNKSLVKKLATKHDFFIAQASIMPKIATIFGRYLGSRGKMPNPKIGCVIPPNANVKQLCDNLKKILPVVTKNEPTIKCKVGYEDTGEDIITDNILTIYNAVLQKLPNDKQNVKSVMLKLTMGPAFVVGKEEAEAKEEEKKGRSKKAKLLAKKEELAAEAKPEEVKEEKAPAKKKGKESPKKA